MDLEQSIMQIIVNGGDARSLALKAVKQAKQADIKGAKSLLEEANQSLKQAHQTQTELIQSELNGREVEITLLMVHAQDHLMNAMTVRDIAVELVDYILEKEEK